MPIVLNGSGPITGVTSLNTTVSDTEIGYLDGVTSALQTQLAGKADTTGNGAWTTFTPTYRSGTGTITTLTNNFSRYLQIGKLVIVNGDFSIVNNGTGATSLLFDLPVTARASVAGQGTARERAITGEQGTVQVNSTTVGLIAKYTGAYFGGNNYTITYVLIYEAA